jgi:hypothetical protein
MESHGFSNPKILAERGEGVYNAKYRERFEKEHLGQFAVIDVVTEQAFVANTAEGAYEQARAAAPQGLFHLIKIGQPGAFRVSYSSRASLDWIFR